MRHGRQETLTGRLARLGFADASASATVLGGATGALLLGAFGGREVDAATDLLAEIAGTADPDGALNRLVALLDAASQPGRVAAALDADPGLRSRVLAVFGVSAALAAFVVRHPESLDELRTGVWSSTPVGPEEHCAALLSAVGAPAAGEPAAMGGAAGMDALRIAYRRALLAITARDVTAGDPTAVLHEVGAELADLAGAALEAALCLARTELPADAPACRLAVIAMGKCGGRELNYLSDVDVIFVAEPATEDDDSAGALSTATRLAGALMRICSTTTSEGSIWEVDAALRPEGKAGPLVRTLASHVAYYARWARTWEFQALLKARPVAGDEVLGTAYIEAVAPFVWQAAQREDFVADVQAMRRRVEEHIPAAEAGRQLKLGRGGLRDVEFAVQLLQLVHGRTDESLRSPGTLEALANLSAGGYVAREDAASLDEAYRFLRTLEHRLQLHRLRRTALVPEDAAELRRLGRALRFTAEPIGELEAAWRRATLEVRRLHEKLFYRPLLAAVARLDPGVARLSPEEAAARLQALGYADPTGSLRHLQALTEGVSRRASIQRTLLPVMLGWFADAPDPDAGLLAFRQVSDALGTTSWYLRLLRDEGAVAQRMAVLLASSRYATDLLLRAPEAVALLASDADLLPRDAAALETEMLAAVGRYEDDAAAAVVARAIRRRELFRTAAADVLHLADERAVAGALSDVAVVTLRGALDGALRSAAVPRRGVLPVRMAVIGMGRLGGREMSYASDADVLFVCEPVDGADEREALEAAHEIAHGLRTTLSMPAPDPPLLVDPDLRPEGRQGPLVRTLASYAAYYERWSHVWERQALLRAEPVAGDPGLGERFMALIQPLRYPTDGLADADVREIRRIKARVEAERLPRGADPSLHLKLGRGGLADVEWTVQLLQLTHAGKVLALQTPRTPEALAAAVEAGAVGKEDAEVLLQSWSLASRLRNGLLLLRGKPADSLPAKVAELNALARLLGRPPGSGAALLEDYRRTTRRARAVVDRVFYGAP